MRLYLNRGYGRDFDERTVRRSARLVSGGPRRQNDSVSRPAIHGETGRRRGGPRQDAIYVSNPTAVAALITQAATT